MGKIGELGGGGGGGGLAPVSVSNSLHSQQYKAQYIVIHVVRENFNGSVSYIPLTLSTQRLLNVSGEIVTNKEFKFKKKKIHVVTTTVSVRVETKFVSTGLY